MIKYLVFNLSFIFLSSISLLGQSGDESPQVIYVSGSSCFINIGKDHGVMVGDTIRFSDSVSIIIVSISAKRSAAKFENGEIPISLLNQAIPVTYLQITATRKLQLEIPPTPNNELQNSKWSHVSSDKEIEKSKQKIIGYVQFQSLFQSYTVADKSFSYIQPGIGIGIEAANFPSANWGMKLRFRSLYDNLEYTRSYDPNKSFFSSFSNRVYEASVFYDNRESGILFQTGRFTVRNLWTAGILDGGNYEQRFGEYWSAGAVLGSSPDYRELNFNANNPKYGGYLIHRTSERQTESIGWIGEYVNYTLSREYLSHQISWFGDGWSWFQSGDIDINRDWKGERDNTIVLSNLMISGRYQFTSYFDSYGSIDIRRPVWTADVKTIADSLFDKRYQEGLTIGGSFEYFETYFTDASAGYRYHDGDQVGTLYLSLANGNRNMMKSGWSLTSRTSLYLNEFYLGLTETIGSTGNLPYDFNGDFSFTVQGSSLSNSSPMNFDFLFQTGISKLIYNNIYGYISYEIAAGKSLDYDRIFLTVNYRF